MTENVLHLQIFGTDKVKKNVIKILVYTEAVERSTMSGGDGIVQSFPLSAYCCILLVFSGRCQQPQGVCCDHQ